MSTDTSEITEVVASASPAPVAQGSAPLVGESEGSDPAHEAAAPEEVAAGASVEGSPKKRKRRRKKKGGGEGAHAQGQPGEGADSPAEAGAASGSGKSAGKGDRRERKPRFDRERPAFAAGDVVFGKVIEITDEAIFVDLSGKGTGIFDRQEMLLSDDAGSDAPGDQTPAETSDASNEAVAVAHDAPAEAQATAPAEDVATPAAPAPTAPPPAPAPAPFAPPIVLEEGAHFVAIVHNDGSRGGLIVLTRHPRRVHAAKVLAEKASKDGTRVVGLVTGVIKGGVEVDVAGLRAFCPASHMSLRLGADLTVFVGQRLEFAVAQYSAKGHNVVLSRRAQLEAEASEHREVALARIRPLVGQATSGIVRSVVPFGAFVDLGDVEGLVPLAEMSHNRSDGPADVFKVGEVVEVQVQKVDDKGKIWLSRKALVDDPWASVAEKYKSGTHHTGKVVRIQPFGVFVELEPGVDGLIRTIDLMFNDRPISLTRFEHPSEVVKVGDEFEVVVSHLEPGAHRISLHPALQGEAASEEPQRVQVYKSAKAVIHTIDLAMLHIRLLGVTGCNARGVVLGSGTGTERGTDLKKKFKVGQVVEGKIMEIEPRRCEVKLSLRALNDDQERNAFKVYRDQVKRDSKFTFGDLLAKKGGLSK